MFENVEDPLLREKLEKVASEHEETAKAVESVQGESLVRYTFSRSTPTRVIGNTVRVHNPLDDEPKGGEIVEKVGQCYRVNVEGLDLIVHEPDDTWG